MIIVFIIEHIFRIKPKIIIQFYFMIQMMNKDCQYILTFSFLLFKG